MLYLCGLRISEVVGNSMGGLFCRSDKSGEPRWWLQVTGKGDKTRLVPATAELMVEVSRYRRLLGLAPLPQEHEAAPLVFPVWWQASEHRRRPIEWPSALTRAAVHGIVKEVFTATAERLRNQGPEHAARAERV